MSTSLASFEFEPTASSAQLGSEATGFTPFVSFDRPVCTSNDYAKGEDAHCVEYGGDKKVTHGSLDVMKSFAGISINRVTTVRAIVLSTIDLKTGLLVGSLSWNRSKAKATQYPMIKPPNSASRSIGRYGMERADRYSAAMGVSEMAKLVTQNPNDPAMANSDALLQVPRGWLMEPSSARLLA